MLFVVILSFFMIFFSKINGCPSQRPCTTEHGTPGSCIQSKDCPYIDKLNGANLTPAELDFVKRSICGKDVDRTKLFCCDNNQIKRYQGSVHRQDNENTLVKPISSNKPQVVQDIIQENNYRSTPATSTQPPTTTLNSPERIVYCRTPNGERAQCISVYQCSILLSNIASVNTTTTENQKRFLKESVCGFDASEKPLVCCGSDAHFNEETGGGTRGIFKQNPYLPVEECGIQNFTLPNRIFGGINSDLNEFPWTALLAFETHDGNNTFACGGSLISSRYILTAAHCVSGQNIGNFANKFTGIRLGEWDFANKGRDCVTTEGRTQCNDAEITVGVESIHPHPEYRVQTREKYHDIALVRLDRDVTFTKYIRPICLPSIDDYVSPGERLTISGWGLVDYNQRTTIKQKVQVPTVSTSQCSIMFERSSRLTVIGKGQFCAGGEPGKDACVGDSGAPLMKKIEPNANTSIWFVEGIVSFGTGCGLVNQYGVYTKVSEYLDWIHKTIKP